MIIPDWVDIGPSLGEWICNECGEIFKETGSDYCPFCGCEDLEEYCEATGERE